MASRIVKNETYMLYNALYNQMSVAFSQAKNAKQIEKKAKSIAKKYAKSKQFQELMQSYAENIATKTLSNQNKDLRENFRLAKETNKIDKDVTFASFKRNAIEEMSNEMYNRLMEIPERATEFYSYEYVKDLYNDLQEEKITPNKFGREIKKKIKQHCNIEANSFTNSSAMYLKEQAAQTFNSVCYFWEATLDNRTRPSHREMNRVIVFFREKWEERPYLDKMNGNAGEFPNCRCSATLIIDKSQLTEMMYSIYNYHTKQIEIIDIGTLLLYINNKEIL